MSFLPFWGVGLTLAIVVVVHWFATGRMMAMSGRFTALVDRLRHGPAEPAPEMSEAELLAALAEATRAQFGDDAVAAAPDEPAAPEPARRPQQPATHILFLAALVAGGVLSSLLGGGVALTTIRGTAFTGLFGAGPLSWLVLFGGGILVGAGTRMAGGCTSGHGLCGVSRFQSGSLVATCAFFGAGIAVSFLLGAVR